ncbi:MAG: (Fe-S)-binding protein [Acidimicrobiales bacterium]
MDLRIDAEDLNSCVQCGLCLPHCPTYRVTGDEALSPRGRIRLMREVQDHGAPITSEIRHAFDTCVQCRGCEPACPSGVPYGRLIESTRETLTGAGELSARPQRLAFSVLAYPRLLRLGSTLLAVAVRLRLAPKRLGLPRDLPLRRARHVASGDDVYLFTGCVMDAWQRDVHHAGQRVMEAAGFGVTPTADLAPCCGALHTHAGLGPDARSRAEATIAALSVDGDRRPIVVDSAGCGAAMKEYGHLLGTAEAESFAQRVVDIQEWLADHLHRLPAVSPLDVCVAVQDPCHLRHVQGVHAATRTVLAPFVHRLIELDDDGLCCGAGGAYSVLHPGIAGDVRARKVDAIDQVSPDLVASANPGCSMHLAGAGVETVHPMELIDRALHGEG